MATVGSAVVELFAVDKSLSKGLNAAKGEVASLEAQGTKSFSTFQKVSTVAYAAVSVAAVKFGIDAVKAYQESQVALATLSNAMRDSPKLAGLATTAFEQQATALQKLTQFSDEQVLSADAVLTRFDLEAGQIQQLIPLVEDLAQAKGIDLVSAADAVGKALLGNTRGLKDVGIEFSATGDRATDFSSIMGLLQQKVGGAAAEFGGTDAGKLKIMANQFDDLKESVGKLISEALTPIVSVMTVVVEGFNSLPGPIKTAVLAGAGLIVALKVISALAGLVSSSLGFLGASAGVAAAALAAEAAATLLAADAKTLYIANASGQVVAEHAVAAAAAESAAAVGSSGLAGALAVLGPIAVAAGLALAAMWVTNKLGISANAQNVQSIERLTEALKSQKVTVDDLRHSVETADLPGWWKDGANAEIDAAAAAAGLDANQKSLGDSTRTSTAAARDAAVAAHSLGEATDEEKAAAEAAAQAAAAEGIQMGILARAHQEVTSSLYAQMNAELSLAGGFLGVLGASNQLIDAQAHLKEVQNDSSASAHDLQVAQEAVLQAQLGLTGSVESYAQSLIDSGKPQSEVIALLREQAAKAGLSKEATQALIDKVKGLVAANDLVDPLKVTKFSAPGLAGVKALVDAYNSALAKIPASVHTSVVTEFQTIGHGNTLAEGGIIAAAGGLVTQPRILRSPTILAGEAGPEAVLPLKPGVLGALGRAIADATGDRRQGSDWGWDSGSQTIVLEMDGEVLARWQRKRELLRA